MGYSHKSNSTPQPKRTTKLGRSASTETCFQFGPRCTRRVCGRRPCGTRQSCILQSTVHSSWCTTSSVGSCRPSSLRCPPQCTLSWSRNWMDSGLTHSHKSPWRAQCTLWWRRRAFRCTLEGNLGISYSQETPSYRKEQLVSDLNRN